MEFEFIAKICPKRDSDRIIQRFRHNTDMPTSEICRSISSAPGTFLSIQRWLRQYLAKKLLQGRPGNDRRLNKLVFEAARLEQDIALWFFETPGHTAVEARMRRAGQFPWNRC